MAEKFTNLVSCTLASSITAVSTTIALKSGDGAKLPSIPNGTANVFRLVLTDKSGNTEIISICRREAGSDTLYVGTSTAHQATGNVAGRGMESTTALAITYTDDHVIELGWTAAQAEAALEYTTLGKLTAAGSALLDDASADAQLTTLGGTAAGTTLFKAATAAAQVTALGLDANMTAVSAATATPTASTIAKFNAAGVMDGAELNMTGETSATSDTGTTTLNIGTVTSGDRIFVSGHVYVNGSGTGGTYVYYIAKSSGTATCTFNHDASNLFTLIPGSKSIGHLSLSGVCRVTGSGTLVLGSYGDAYSETPDGYEDNQIYAFFLKKA